LNFQLSRLFKWNFRSLRREKLDRKERIAASPLVHQLCQRPGGISLAVRRIGDQLVDMANPERRENDVLHSRSDLADRVQRLRERVRGANLVVAVGPDNRGVRNCMCCTFYSTVLTLSVITTTYLVCIRSAEVIVQCGAVERARALDLGADDVISFPFEAVEFAARIRAQFRERTPQEELKTMLKYAVQTRAFRGYRSPTAQQPELKAFSPGRARM
jgi:hypothetical protein